MSAADAIALLACLLAAAVAVVALLEVRGIKATVRLYQGQATDALKALEQLRRDLARALGDHAEPLLPRAEQEFRAFRDRERTRGTQT